MERVGTLINKLNEQYNQHQDADKLLITTQLLLAELVQINPVIQQGKVAISMPNIVLPAIVVKKEIEVVEEVQPPIVEVASIAQEIQEEKLQEVLPVAEVEPEKNEAAIIPETKKLEQASWLFDTEPHIPTLAHQAIKEVESNKADEKLVFELKDVLATDNEPSFNDKLKVEKTEVVEVLKATPVKDLKKAIGINDQYLFINELFRGDEAMYERSIKTINSFSIFAEAEYWIQRELKVKLGWEENTEAVQHFNQLVRRRFL